MVRTTNNDEAEDKKETTRKKASAAKNMKKPLPTIGIWPCKMNGCTKQFAREADLKRHQRTTKLHSMPSFACPQCDATFTRTDALRRHQKSRHNGAAEPLELGKETDEPGQSSSRSSSATPSSKGKERENSVVPMVPMTEAIGSASTSSLATPVTSYYRQHTANNSNYAPPRPAHYAQVNLPISDGRPNSNGWSHPPPWSDGQGHSSPTAMPYMYIASPYYRTNAAVMVAPPLLTPVSQTPGPSAFSNSPHSRKAGDYNTSPDSPGSSSSSLMADIEANDVFPPISSHHSNIDPSPSQTSSAQSFDQILSKAGMEAVSCEEPNHRGSGMDEFATRVGTSHDFAQTKDPPKSIPQDLDETHLPSLEIDDDQEEQFRRRLIEHGYEPRIARPAPMEHMLTDDGEPMLNPAELLTQAGKLLL
ncbi:hypothetical protein E1B28_001785 [Marasmius oreades]|uniref:C2H2-type domain-containing protein n=1 Tax=Marasmius oreades TaxID=181124 RepID=A0A9P7V438_9AGAR|nr:uncharacterized protein E1B28_001785 [Marasmius oreades]KAG7099996.1 hypothetical protein E1B28_001785 [Marasmius oreades]